MTTELLHHPDGAAKRRATKVTSHTLNFCLKISFSGNCGMTVLKKIGVLLKSFCVF